MYNDKHVYNYYTELSKKSNLELVSLGDIEIQPGILNEAHCYHYLQLQAIPISSTDHAITIAIANPDDGYKEKIRNFFDTNKVKKIEYVLASRQDIVRVLEKQ